MIALLAGAGALVLAALLDASIGGRDGARRAGTASPDADRAAAVDPPRRRHSRPDPSGEAPLAPIDLVPVVSTPRATSPPLPVRNAEYRLELGRGEWIAARPNPGLSGTSDDVGARAGDALFFGPDLTAFVPPEAAEVRAAGHSAQPVRWLDDPEARIERRAVIEPDAVLLVRGPGLGAHGEDLRITDTWHEEAGRRTLTPAVLLVEALDADTIAIAADTERWKPVLGSRTGEGRLELTPFTRTSVFWRAEPGVQDEVDLGVPASWITFTRARNELHEHGAATDEFMERRVRARLHGSRSVRRDVEDRVRIATRIGGEVIEEVRVHPHPRIDLPVGLGPVTASIVREDGHQGALCFEPEGERVEVTMRAPSPITGRVVDQRGSPIEGAGVMLHLPLERERPWTDGCVTRSGPGGTFTLTAPGPPPLRIVEPGEPITPPTRAFVDVHTLGGGRARTSVTLLPGRTAVAGDVVVELKTHVKLLATASIRRELGEVLDVAWPAHTTEVTGQRWEVEDELVCELAPGTSWAVTPEFVIVRTTTGTFAAAREGEDLVLGPTYRRELTIDIEAEPGERLVLLYVWRGSRCVAFEPERPVPGTLTWTASFPAPRAYLVYELRDAKTDVVRSSGSFGTAGALGDTLRIAR